MDILYFFIGLVVVAGVVMFAVKKLMRGRTLSKASSSRIHALFERSDHISDPLLRVLEYDKILDQLLLELGYKGSTGEKLMKGGPRFANKDMLWKYHKLRNIVAHEHGAGVTANEADHFRNAVLKAFRQVS